MTDSSVGSLSQSPPSAIRLASLDAYRGWVMLLMMAEVLHLCRVAAALPGNAFWGFLCHHQSHVEWIGCSLHDLIQPSFSFLVGVALPFSIAARAARGQSRGRMLGHALWRSVILVLLGVVVFSLYGAFRTELEKSEYIGFLGGILLGAFMVSLILVVLIVPERRRTAWVEALTSVNAKYLFLGLIVAWALAMGLLASLGLEVNTVGVPALIGLFAGIFIFMGFIWSVIGE